MTPELIALSRRLVACEGFRWMPGMKVLDRHLATRVHSIQPDGLLVLTLVDDKGPYAYVERAGHKIPDLSDPATLGTVEALAIQQHPTCRIQRSARVETGERYAVVTWEGLDGRTHSTGRLPDAEALVAALEAAP